MDGMRHLALAAMAVLASAIAGCSPPTARSCSASTDCPRSAICREGLCLEIEPSRFVYVADTNASTISRFAIDAITGGLTPVETMPGGSHPTGLVMHPSGRFLVAANSDAAAGTGWGGVGTVSVYSFNAATGALIDVPGSPFPANQMALNIAVTPDGRFVYTTDQFGFRVTTFAFDSATGALVQAPFSPLGEPEAHAITMHPSGRFFYVGAESGGGGDNIKGHAIAADGSYGDTPGSPYPTAMATNWLSITPDGRFLYTTDANMFGSGILRGFSIDPATGQLVELAWSPLNVAPGDRMATSVVTPRGDFLYVGIWSAGTVGAWSINQATGALTAVPGSPFPAGTNPKSLAVDSQSRRLYVANYGASTVNAFLINEATGALAPVGTYPTGLGPKMLITVP